MNQCHLLRAAWQLENKKSRKTRAALQTWQLSLILFESFLFIHLDGKIILTMMEGMMILKQLTYTKGIEM